MYFLCVLILETVMGYFTVVLFDPLILLTNAVLILRVILDWKQSNPSRWLVCHTSLCTFFNTLLMYDSEFTRHFGLPSLHTTAACPVIMIASLLVYPMSDVSSTLVIIDRLVALRKYAKAPETKGKNSDWTGRGIGKKVLIVTVVCFWLAIILELVITTAIERATNGRVIHSFSLGNSLTTCFISYNPTATNIYTLFFFCFYLASAGVVLAYTIHSLILDKFTSSARHVAIGTLVYVLCFILHVCIQGLLLVFRFKHYTRATTIMSYLLNVSFFLTGVLFPAIWLALWYLEGTRRSHSTCKITFEENIQLFQSESESLEN